jgi:hypothetical protein
MCLTFYLFGKCVPDHFDESKEVRGAQEAERLIANMAGCCILSCSVGINHLLIFSSLGFCLIPFISSLDSAIYVYTSSPIFIKTSSMQECVQLREIKRMNFSNSTFLLYMTLPFFTHSPKNYKNYFQDWYHVYMCDSKVIKCLDED